MVVVREPVGRYDRWPEAGWPVGRKVGIAHHLRAPASAHLSELGKLLNTVQSESLASDQQF